MFYAAKKPPIPVCFSFDTKKLRDEWVVEMNRRDKARCTELLARMGATEQDFERIYEVNFYALTKREALKKWGHKDYFGRQALYIHRHITDINDEW